MRASEEIGMSDTVVAFSCPGGSHAWGKVKRAELVEVSEWVERATCRRCGAQHEVYFDNGEEMARFTHAADYAILTNSADR